MRRLQRQKNVWVGFRATEPQMDKLIAITERTGMNLSEVMRALVDTADVKSVQRIVPTVRQ